MGLQCSIIKSKEHYILHYFSLFRGYFVHLYSFIPDLCFCGFPCVFSNSNLWMCVCVCQVFPPEVFPWSSRAHRQGDQGLPVCCWRWQWWPDWSRWWEEPHLFDTLILQHLDVYNHNTLVYYVDPGSYNGGCNSKLMWGCIQQTVKISHCLSLYFRFVNYFYWFDQSCLWHALSSPLLVSRLCVLQWCWPLLC